MCSFSYNVVFLARGTRHCTARKFATPPCVSPFGHKENRRVYTLCPASKKQKLVLTGAFRPLTGSSAASWGRFCDSCIPIVLPHGSAPFSESVRQDDRNAYFLCRPIVGLTPPKLPALGSNLRLHRGLYLCTDIVTPVMALYHNTNTSSNCQAFFTNFFKNFWAFMTNFRHPKILW